MIRRALWLAVGAVLGVMGYRRLDRAARSLTGQLTSLPGGRHAARPAGTTASARAGSAARFAARMAGWLTRRTRDRREAASRTGGGVAAFVSDVRVGIDEYLDARDANMNRQYVPAGNTLVGQRTAGDETKEGR